MYKRAYKIIEKAVKELNVSLANKVVLTEVGTNNYIFTPFIASMCSAKKVYAVAKNTTYGNVKDIFSEANELCQIYNIHNIEFITAEDISDKILNEVDVITNSGNLRPLNERLLSRVRNSLVIPIMYEAWEIRDEDIDIQYCKGRGIKVAGTWENHPSIKVFDYCGQLAMKMGFNAGYEIFGNKIIVWSDDHFGEIISEKFVNEGASVILTSNINEVYKEIYNTDFIFITDYDEERNYFSSQNSIFDIAELIRLNSSFGIVHLFGKVDVDFITKFKINVSPLKQGQSKTMTFTLGHIGLNPILKLQVAGLKVAEEMIAGNLSSLSQLIC